ncbi:response regulator [Chitinimonas lacunae]|uniref:Response regulator n=1 Tax=Chitinimonas lacunae TaxID=1963018 RepID=A0ABV8MLH8_9NEIS
MPKLIMIVDDSPSLRQVLAITLRSAGYEVLEACDGLDALNKLSGQPISLVISDVNMPNMDGLAFIGELKKNPAYKCAPVIMLTTEMGEDKRRAGQSAGAKAWMIKPFQPRQILSAVERLAM